jgi:hypothetical protein
MDNKTVVYAHNLLANNSTSFVTLPPDFGYAKLREEKKKFQCMQQHHREGNC